MSELATSMRTHACGELRGSDIGSEVAVCGWVARQRDHGGLTFVDLRDREGLVQLVFHPEEAPEAQEVAHQLKTESVIRVTGEVTRRPKGTVKPRPATREAGGALRIR